MLLVIFIDLRQKSPRFRADIAIRMLNREASIVIIDVRISPCAVLVVHHIRHLVGECGPREVVTTSCSKSTHLVLFNKN